MNILFNNLLDKYSTEYSSTDKIFKIENIKIRRIAEAGKFAKEDTSKIIIKDIASIDFPNTFACFDTDATSIIINFFNTERERESLSNTVYVGVKNEKAFLSFNKEKTKHIEIIFNRTTEKEEGIKIGLLIIGCSFLLPPRDISEKTETTFTREQFFSVSREYFRRYLPIKKYKKIEFSFKALNKKQKEDIECFFEKNNFEPFVLWTSEHNEKKEAIFDLSIFDIDVYAGDEEDNTNSLFSLYVCIDESLVFEESSNKNSLYPYSTSLSFMEVF